jgi:uncharacterized protein YukE
LTASFSVDPEQLRTHASTLAGYADQLDSIGTRLPDQLGDQSLGSLAQFVTAGLGGAMTATLDAFTQASSTVDQVSGGVRNTADDYQRTDDTNASEFGGLEERV